MRKICIGHGMKMYLDRNQTRAWAERVASEFATRNLTTEVFFFPQFGFLSDVEQIIGKLVGYGGQNMAAEDVGAFTGEVSVKSLVQLGCTHVELGHSERRALFNENDAAVSRKTRLALDHGLRPVICIGEDQEDLSAARSFLAEQVPAVLSELRAEEIPNVILAYEPRWAIGQTKSAETGYIQEVHSVIRGTLSKQYGTAVADNTRIIYGGSVNLSSGREILSQPDVDGLFIGRAALDPGAFLQFIEMGESR